MTPPVPAGFDFAGWYYNPEYAGDPIASLTIESDTDLYAKFTRKTYTAIFETFGHGEIDPLTLDFESGEVDLPLLDGYQGHSFVGWRFSQDFSDEPIFFLSIDRLSESSTTLYACFQPYSISVVLDPNGGVLLSPVAIIEYGQDYTLEIPTRDGYDFLGYYDQEGNQLTNAKGQSLVPCTDLEGFAAIAKWERRSYTVIFNPQGGTFTGERSLRVYANSLLEEPMEPTHGSMIFITGWYTDLKCTELFDFTTPHHRERP